MSSGWKLSRTGVSWTFNLICRLSYNLAIQDDSDPHISNKTACINYWWGIFSFSLNLKDSFDLHLINFDTRYCYHENIFIILSWIGNEAPFCSFQMWSVLSSSDFFFMNCACVLSKSSRITNLVSVVRLSQNSGFDSCPPHLKIDKLIDFHSKNVCRK